MSRFRPMLREHGLTEQQWRVIRALADYKEIDAGELAKKSFLLAPSLTRILQFLEKEKIDGKKPFNLPVKNEGVFRGEFEVYDENQQLVGHNQVTVTHRPINLLHSEQTIEIEGVINQKWTTMRTRNGGSHQYHGPDMFGNGKSYGRYLYSIRHVFGEAYKMWSRETVVDEDYTMVCAWQFMKSQKEQYMTFGVLRFEAGENVLAANYVD